MKTSPPSLHRHPDPRVASMYRRLSGIAATVPTSAQPAKAKTTASKPAKAAPPRRTAAKPMNFAHLNDAVRFDELPAEGAPRVATAAEILAAGRKARSPTGCGAPRPTGFAARVLAAGRKARGEA